MGKGASVNFKELQKFRHEIEKNLSGAVLERFIESCSKELAARLLAKVIKRTPVGEYPMETGKKGGTLRRGWTGEKSQGATEYANGLKVTRSGGGAYVIEIINPVEYASYVEYGHRQTPGRFVPAIGKRLVQGWVEGKFMLTISEDEIRNDAPRVLQNKLNKKLKEIFK